MPGLGSSALFGRRALLRRSEGAGARIPRIGAACRDHRLCVALCPEAALAGFELDGRRGVALRLEACTGCGRCAELCPERAIELVAPPPGASGVLPLSAHAPQECARCLEPFVGPAGAELCPACAKDTSLFGAEGRGAIAAPPGGLEGEWT